VLFGQFVAAEHVSNARKGGRRSHDENGVGVLIPNVEVARLDQYLAVPEVIFPLPPQGNRYPSSWLSYPTTLSLTALILQNGLVLI
jgi:hypothetical protein